MISGRLTVKTNEKLLSSSVGLKISIIGSKEQTDSDQRRGGRGITEGEEGERRGRGKPRNVNKGLTCTENVGGRREVEKG